MRASVVGQPYGEEVGEAGGELDVVHVAVAFPGIDGRARLDVEDEHVVGSGFDQKRVGTVFGHEMFVGHVGIFRHAEGGRVVDFRKVAGNTVNVVIFIHRGGRIQEQMVPGSVAPGSFYLKHDSGFAGVGRVLGHASAILRSGESGGKAAREKQGCKACLKDFRFPIHSGCFLVVYVFVVFYVFVVLGFLFFCFCGSGFSRLGAALPDFSGTVSGRRLSWRAGIRAGNAGKS